MMTQISPQTFDLVILLFFAVAAMIGVISGMSRILLSLGSWVGSVASMVFLFPVAHTYAKTIIQNDLLAGLAAGSVIFITSFSLLVFVSNSLSSVIRASALGSIDRALGLLIGLAMGGAALCCGGMVAPFVFDDGTRVRLAEQSKFFGYIEWGADQLKDQARLTIKKLFPDKDDAVLAQEPPATPRASSSEHRPGPSLSSSSPKKKETSDQAYERLASPPIAPRPREAKHEKGYDAHAREILKKLTHQTLATPDASTLTPESTSKPTP